MHAAHVLLHVPCLWHACAGTAHSLPVPIEQAFLPFACMPSPVLHHSQVRSGASALCPAPCPECLHLSSTTVRSDQALLLFVCMPAPVLHHGQVRSGASALCPALLSTLHACTCCPPRSGQIRRFYPLPCPAPCPECLHLLSTMVKSDQALLLFVCMPVHLSSTTVRSDQALLLFVCMPVHLSSTMVRSDQALLPSALPYPLPCMPAPVLHHGQVLLPAAGHGARQRAP